MKFVMFRPADQPADDRSVQCTFTNGSGVSRTTWFSGPPKSIDHVGIGYIQDRLPNVVRREQEAFIKRRFKEEIVKFRID